MDITLEQIKEALEYGYHVTVIINGEYYNFKDVDRIEQKDFTYKTKCKGMWIGDYRITNNSNYLVFYKDRFVGELRTKRDAIKFIDNMVKYQRLEYTEEG